MENIFSNVKNFNIKTLSIEKLKYKDLWWFFYGQDLENDNNYALRFFKKQIDLIQKQNI